uniref:Uncharacterized protein n=1 Tax=Romanomermis culicivorax TaxID=13658 RepID=A0A915HTX4_ROMCU
MSDGGKKRLPWMKKRNKSLQMLVAHQAKAQRSAQSSLGSLSTDGDDTGPDCQNRSSASITHSTPLQTNSNLKSMQIALKANQRIENLSLELTIVSKELADQIRILCKKIDLRSEFNFPCKNDDVMKKESSVQSLAVAIMDHIEAQKLEIRNLEEDICVYKRLETMIKTCLESKAKPVKISRLCSSNFCFSSFPLFKEYCDSFNYCSQCQNMMHVVCSLVLTKNQMALSNSAKSGDFICFDCRGQNDIAAILEMCSNKLADFNNQLTTMITIYEENRIKSDKQNKKLESSQGTHEKTLFCALESLGVDLQAYHSGSFVGNHVFKMLKVTDKINGPRLLTKCLENTNYEKLFYDGLVHLGQIFELTTKTGFLTDDEIIDLDKYCRCLKEMMARDFPDWTTTHHHLLASVKDSQRFLPIRRKIKKFVENEGKRKTADGKCDQDNRFSDDDFEVEF